MTVVLSYSRMWCHVMQAAVGRVYNLSCFTAGNWWKARRAVNRRGQSFKLKRIKVVLVDVHTQLVLFFSGMP